MRGDQASKGPDDVGSWVRVVEYEAVGHGKNVSRRGLRQGMWVERGVHRHFMARAPERGSILC